jgi:hypothetical protein
MTSKRKNQKIKNLGIQSEEVEDDRFMIKVGQLGGRYVARAFPRASARSKGTLFEAKGNSNDEALEALRRKIELSQADDIAGRREIATSGFLVPQTKEYASALQQVTLSKTQTEMLKAHAWSEGPGMTMRELAVAAGLRSVRSANTAYGKVGTAICENLGLGDVSSQSSVAGPGLGFLAVSEESAALDEERVWIMHPELKDAVRSEL